MQLIRRFDGLVGAFAAVCVGMIVGCGDNGGGSDSVSGSESQSGTGGSEPTTGTPTEPTGSASMSDSTTGAEGGMSDSLSGTVSSGVESDSASGTTTGTSEMGTGGGESTSGSSSTGEPVDCTTLDNEADCVAADCLAINGRQFISDDADLCLDSPSFLACLEPMVCDDALEYVCKGQVKYQLPSGCIPPGFMKCPAPPDAGMDGWKDCP